MSDRQRCIKIESEPLLEPDHPESGGLIPRRSTIQTGAAPPQKDLLSGVAATWGATGCGAHRNDAMATTECRFDRREEDRKSEVSGWPWNSAISPCAN